MNKNVTGTLVGQMLIILFAVVAEWSGFRVNLPLMMLGGLAGSALAIILTSTSDDKS